jgi:CDP-glycerol glycerophosphotransferase (TagB/SpsB family)
LVDSASPGELAKRVATNPNPAGTVPLKLSRKPFWAKGASLAEQAHGLRERVEPAARERGKRIAATALKQLARAPWVRKRFAAAWLLIDRDNQAQDNAERFYDYLQENQPQVNAWFVLNRKSTDWDRLQRKGFKLISHRSPLHAAAVQHCSQLISSQVDHYVVAPIPPGRFPYTWQYTFLQHGVTKDDLSTWINPKPIDLMLTVTPDEHASIVDDYTPYRYTDREIKMTGFPRHDRLLALGNSLAPEQRRVVLVTPTWRRELLGETTGRSNVRDLRADFWHSDYAQQWRGFLESEQLHKAAEEHGWQVIFLPHPNMTDYLDDSPLGDHIHVQRFRDIDVQQLIAEAGVLVTDYSSMAFESAYLQRGVVYFQFDRDEFFSGAHAYRKGTWSYDDSGFGPVTEQVDDAIREVTALMSREGRPDETYAKRMADTFPLRDGLCSQRTYEAIRAMEPKRR